jgi:hypothetical protein
MKIKLLLGAVCAMILVSSCKLTTYSGFVGQSTATRVDLSQANFQVLGSFTGTGTAKTAVVSIKDKTGVIADAKADLIANAKAAGVELTGSRALVNVTTDIIQNSSRITCTMSAEIIEFTK